MSKESQQIREQIIGRELRNNVEAKTMLEFELALQKQLDPEEESVKVPARIGNDGKPLSHKMIKRSEYIVIIEDKLEDVNLRISTLENL